MKEKLKFVTGFKDYVISDHGNVYSFKFGRVKKLKSQDPGSGYLHVRLSRQGQYYMKNVHRLVVEHFINDFNHIYVTNHIDGNKSNNHINNLQMCSQKDNMIHAWDKGLMPYSKNIKE